MRELPTGTVTFLFTDLEGSTRLWEEHAAAMSTALARHDALLRSAVEGNVGLAFFPPSVVDAEIKDGMLKALEISGTRLSLSFNLIYHREKRASPLIRAFIEVLKEQRPKLMHDRSLMRR